MGVTQYIGARYVPLFADPADWNSTRTYEPLTIVLHEGNSYTSRQFVPKGIDITNSEYWAETGNYNAQVEAYRQEVQGFSDRIDQANRKADQTASDLVEFEGDITEQFEDFKEETEEALKTAGHKRVAIYIGNSYTNGEGSTSGSDGLRALTANRLFDDNYRFTAGGAGFQTYTNHETTFYNLLQTAAESRQFDNDSVTDIIFVSAMGDTRALCEGKTLESNIQACANYIKKDFPNAKMYVTYAEMVAGRTTQNSYSPKYWMYQLRVHQVFMNESLKRNYTYLGWIGWNGNNLSGYNAADGYHPNDAGYQLLAGAFINAYCGVTPYITKTAAKDNVNVFADDPMRGRLYIPAAISNTLFPDGIQGTTDYKITDIIDATSIMAVLPLQTQNNIYQCLALTSNGVIHPACVWMKIDNNTGNAELMIRFRETIESPVPNMNSNRRLDYAASISAGLSIIFN